MASSLSGRCGKGTRRGPRLAPTPRDPSRSGPAHASPRGTDGAQVDEFQ
ncbi:MAG: hypothetical protein JOZ47_02400 [Kutzneria sp.]|nr:hypothetical protein [Kutzneria sp.]